MAKVYHEHYNCEKLVNSLDKNGDKPAFFIVCSKERGPGKTYSFSKKLIERFLDTGDKFILLTRNKGDIGSIAAGIMDGYLVNEHPEYTVSEKSQMKDTYARVYLSHIEKDDQGKDKQVNEECGYVIPIRSADKIKKISSLFYDAWCFYFDEFQPFSDPYLKDEVDLLYNIYKSIARGEGHATRYMPVFLASNTITLGNPYFEAFDLNKHIQSNTKFYKGDGVIYERCEVEGLAEEHPGTAIDRALRVHRSRKGDNTWIMDDNSLVEKPDSWGRGYYICTLKYKGQAFGLLDYPMVGMQYVTRKIDKSCQYIYNTTKDGGALNLPLLKQCPVFVRLKKYFFDGQVRCQDGSLQRTIIDIIA